MVPSVAGQLLHNGALQDLSVLPPLVHCRNKRWRALQFANGHRCSYWAASCICIVLIPVAFSSLSTHRSLTDSITAAGLGVLTWWLSFLRGSNGWLAGRQPWASSATSGLGPQGLGDAASSVVMTCSALSTLMRATASPRRSQGLASNNSGAWLLASHMEKLCTCWILVLVLIYIHNHLYMWSICPVYEW
jgi:hypothetical protein